ncbi:unnamed protein product [marine sediment metagenome]|uniref:Uncharacterized protein n=1 Tax=marine sediment metagenome TaxID=412755 RepID=X1LER3_9ZZZZ
MSNNDKVARVHSDLYEKAQAKAKAEGISTADAIAKLVAQGGVTPPTSCQLGHFADILAEQGLAPPRRPDWVWGVTDVLPAGMLRGTKLEPYAKARSEAELRCALGDELYGKLTTGELSDGEIFEEPAAEEAAAEEAAEAAEVTG